MKRETAALNTRTGNKGRITRADQAWGPAHNENIEFDRAARVALHGVKLIDVDHAEYLASMDEDLPQVPAIRETVDGDEETADLPSTVVQFPTSPFSALTRAEPEQASTPLSTLAVPLKFVASALLTAAKQDIRYYLNGVYIHVVDDEVRVCSTDGHRLIVSRFESGKDFPIPQWARDGVIIPRDELAQALPILSKNAKLHPHDCAEPAMLIDFGTGHPMLTLRAPNGFAAFRMKPIDGKFPDYAKVIAGSAAVLARGEGEAMTASAINTVYLKSAADIAAKLEAKAVHAFIGSHDDKACFFTFDGAPDTVLVIMPMRTGEAVSSGVVKLIGRDGIQASISALKAHVTRTVKALEHAEGADRKGFEDRKSSLEQRIAALLAATGQGPKQLTQQAAA